ncbi:hypothetical protein PG996_000856 [Apiospora saccharicola]|uniref:Uncharacterized protein n=1 Tax=Apiospora saccharicola TaxID=335842 RepID=A0ABR1WEZ0_9PEZI
MKLLVTTIACLLGFLGLVESQGFLNNCTWQSANLTGSFLGMYCNDDDWADYGYQWSWFDINPCLINNGGQLIPYDKQTEEQKLTYQPPLQSGGFTTSCTHLNFTATNLTFALTAECSDTSDHFVPAAYDLSCFEHHGNATECGPQCDPGFHVIWDPARVTQAPYLS